MQPWYNQTLLSEPVYLPGLLRMQWAGAEARDHWQPLLETALQANVHFLIYRLEKESCSIGVLKTKPSRSFHIEQELLKQGMYFKAIKEFELAGLFLTEVPCKYLSNEPSVYYLAAKTNAALTVFETLLEDNDVAGQRIMVGLPEVQQPTNGWTDPVMELLLASFGDEENMLENNRVIEPESGEQNQLAKLLLLNYLGLNLIRNYHRPLLSAESISETEALLSALENRQKTVAESLKNLLRLPMELTSLHGMAEVKTPVLKFITNSDGLKDKVTIRLAGSGEAIEKGAKGLRFPYAVR